jgi:hypothetical protein
MRAEAAERESLERRRYRAILIWTMIAAVAGIVAAVGAVIAAIK